VDQRHQIARLIAKCRGIAEDQLSFADMVAVKRLLVEELGQHASAVLLDPNYRFPAALQQLRAGANWHGYNAALDSFEAEGEVCAAYR
ncbi:MAG: hypothetical protein K0B16_09870, partial [Burkholderiaceae bacterium]|nr:hypothetical protein [Burkholderiaceae bacterium]